MLTRCLIALGLTVLPVWGLCSLDLFAQNLALCLYGAMSVISFVQFMQDKRAAIRNTQRIAEKTLHLTALLGGWPGAWLARRVLHHKTIKQPFVALFYAIVALHQLLWGIWLIVSDTFAFATLLSRASYVVCIYV